MWHHKLGHRHVDSRTRSRVGYMQKYSDRVRSVSTLLPSRCKSASKSGFTFIFERLSSSNWQLSRKLLQILHRFRLSRPRWLLALLEQLCSILVRALDDEDEFCALWERCERISFTNSNKTKWFKYNCWGHFLFFYYYIYIRCSLLTQTFGYRGMDVRVLDGSLNYVKLREIYYTQVLV